MTDGEDRVPVSFAGLLGTDAAELGLPGGAV